MLFLKLFVIRHLELPSCASCVLMFLLAWMLTGSMHFVLSDCAEKEVAPEGRDDMVARKLWEESARLVGLKDAF